MKTVIMKGGLPVNIFFRTLLAIYAFCLAVISAVAMYIIVRPVAYTSVTGYVAEHIFTNGASALRIAVFIIALIFFAMSIIFLLSGVRSNKDKKAVSKHTNIGEVKISLNSIENIALNAARKVNGVRETKAYVNKIDDNVAISIKLVVMPDVNIPSISEDVQERVKKSVEESSGISVKEVKVIVESIFSGTINKTRVE